MTDSTAVVSVRCNHCGAPLEVSGGARFLTCSYCQAQLEIRRSGGAVYTEVIDQINQRTERIERDVEQIKRQNAIEQLDREWEMRRRSLLVHNKNGGASAPSTGNGAIGAVIAVVGGVGSMVLVGAAGAPAPVMLFGLLFMIVGLATSISQMVKADQYSREESAYRARRNQLLREAGGELR